MHLRTDDLRIREIRELITPEQVTIELPCSDTAAATVEQTRRALQNILHGRDEWGTVTLDTVTLTNTSQLYFDTTAWGQPERLYRLMPLP